MSEDTELGITHGASQHHAPPRPSQKLTQNPGFVPSMGCKVTVQTATSGRFEHEAGEAPVCTMPHQNAQAPSRQANGAAGPVVTVTRCATTSGPLTRAAGWMGDGPLAGRLLPPCLLGPLGPLGPGRLLRPPAGRGFRLGRLSPRWKPLAFKRARRLGSPALPRVPDHPRLGATQGAWPSTGARPLARRLGRRRGA